jgi:hypothetical protein
MRRGSTEDLLEAARLNTSLWGDARNPILPIDGDLERATKLVSEFQVDLLHPIIEGDENLDAVVNAFTYLEPPPELRMERLRILGRERRDVVDIRVLASHYFNSIVRFGGEGSRSAMGRGQDVRGRLGVVDRRGMALALAAYSGKEGRLPDRPVRLVGLRLPQEAPGRPAHPKQLGGWDEPVLLLLHRGE